MDNVCNVPGGLMKKVEINLSKEHILIDGTVPII